MYINKIIKFCVYNTKELNKNFIKLSNNKKLSKNHAIKKTRFLIFKTKVVFNI